MSKLQSGMGCQHTRDKIIAEASFAYRKIEIEAERCQHRSVYIAIATMAAAKNIDISKSEIHVLVETIIGSFNDGQDVDWISDNMYGIVTPWFKYLSKHNGKEYLAKITKEQFAWVTRKCFTKLEDLAYFIPKSLNPKL
jgi:hypothetical protein